MEPVRTTTSRLFGTGLLHSQKKSLYLRLVQLVRKSLAQVKKCGEKEGDFLENVILMKMGTAYQSSNEFFHYRNAFPKDSGVFIDSGCQSELSSKACVTNPFENIRFAVENVFSKKK